VRRSGLAALAVAAIPLAACGAGGNDDRFTAEGFVAAVNEHGAGVELGEPLPYERADAELHNVTFEEATEDHAAEAEEEEGHAHGSGTLAVFADEDAAFAEYERCSATTLECYRAANVAVSFLEAESADLDRLTAALQALAAQ
jgi:hypothetical protein